MSRGIRPNHPLFARYFLKSAPFFESRGAAEHRSELLAGCTGRVLEVGAGSGLNFSHYQPGAWVIALEPEPHLGRVARQAARKAAVSVQLVDGLAEDLPFPDRSFDVVVASLVLCSVSDLKTSVHEIFRILRGGGCLVFYEHIRSSRPEKAAVQVIMDAIRPGLAGGCHCGRDTIAAIRGAGFEEVRARTFTFMPRFSSWPTSDVVIGRAIRP